MAKGVSSITAELQHAVSRCASLGAAAGALTLGLDALMTEPRGVLLALALGWSAGLVAGASLGITRVVTQRLPLWAGLLGWVLAGVGLALLSAVGIGALDHLRGQRRLLAMVTLSAAGIGGAALGVALALVQCTAIRIRWPRYKRSLERGVGGVCLVVSAGVIAAPTFARWLLVYPLAMKVSVAIAFAFAFCAIASLAGERWFAFRHATRICVAGAALASASLAWAPPRAFNPVLATHQGSQLVLQLRAMTDFDGDGASGLFGGTDCAPTDPRVHPWAREVPENGIDDNCLLGDAKAVADPPLSPQPAASEPSPVSVVVITIDALRADHTEPYGYPKPTTPELSKFARGARRYDRAFTAGGRTGLGLVALLGGLEPRRQRWQIVPRVIPGRTAERSPWDFAPRQWVVPPIPAQLARRGMRTGAVLHYGAASWFAAGATFEAVFDAYAVAPHRDDLPDSRTVDAALRMLESFGSSRFFLWVHLYGPHEPHLPPPPEAPDFGTGIVAAYDADIWQTDRELGRLLRAVDAVQGPPRMIVITADHSEEFAGDRTFHAVDMFNETARIPLFVSGPGVDPGVDGRIVSAVDLAPTVMAWTRTASPYPGFSLTGPARRRVALCDAIRPNRDGTVNLEQVVASDGDTRYVLDMLLGRELVAPEQHVGEDWAVDPATADRLKRSALEYIEAHGPIDAIVGAADGASAPPAGRPPVATEQVANTPAATR